VMQWIVSSSIRLRTLVAAFAALLLIAGGWQLRSVPLDAVPEFSPLSLQVKTEALGLSASEVEALITVPMEADLLNGVPWLQSIESESVTGLSSIEMFFVPGTDLMKARQMIEERLVQAHALPNVSKPPRMLQPVASAGRIMNVSLTSKTVPLIDMSVQAQWNIVPRLAGVPGVSNVSIWGQRDRQLQVLVDPKRLNDANVTLEQIVKTSGEAVWASPLTFLNSSTPGSGGFIDTPNQRLNIRHVSPILTANEFARIPVHGTAVALSDVANVVESHQPLIGDAVYASGPGLMLVIEKFPDFNTQDVTRGVEAVLASMRPGLTGIDIDTTIYRPASFIERATSNLSTGLMASGALAIIAFCALLGSWRAAFVGLVAMAASLMAAGLVLHLRGVNFNMMVIIGMVLAIGVIIDDAIADITNIARRLREPRTLAAGGVAAGQALRNPIVSAALAVRGPTFYATLILAVAVLPILFMQGLSASFFQPMIWSYLLALVVSMLVALTVTPALAALLLTNGPPSEDSTPRLMGAMHRAYDRIAGSTAKSVIPGVVMLVGAGFVGYLVWSQEDRSLIPSFNETDIFVEFQGAPGTSLPAMNATTQSLIQEIRKIPGVVNAGAQVGRAQLSYDVADVNSAEVWVSIDPRADYEPTLAAIQQAAGKFPGYSGEVETYLSKKMHERLTGQDETITVRLYGHDLSILRAKAEEVGALLSKIDGVKKPRVEQQAEREAIEVSVDLDKAREHGLKPGDVRRAASTLVSGITVGALFHDQKIVDVVVWGVPDIRRSPEDVSNLLIETGSGDLVRLADVATVKTVPATSVIRRQGVSRRLDVEAAVSGRALGEVTQEVARRITDIAFPFEYHAQVMGEHVERQAALRSVYAYAIAACVMIFLLLQAAFGSWRMAVVSIVSIPAALLGGLIVMLFIKETAFLGGILGLITVAGVAVRNAILLVKRFQILEHRDGADAALVVSHGVNERFQSIVTTAIATAAVVLPFAVMGDVAGLEIFHPAALVILGGLVTSTVFSLFVVPALYTRFGLRSRVDEMAMAQAAD
jgi:Cu/Ag efflux pump CusA